MTTPASTTQALYFNEGPGYFFLNILGSGVEANACTVRSRLTDELLVRKELIKPEEVSKTNGTYFVRGTHGYNILVHLEYFTGKPYNQKLTDAPPEVAIARRLQHIPGVAKLRGWVRHAESTGRERAVHASYWKFYNQGQLADVAIKARYGLRDLMPEYWTCRILADMVDTLVRVHEAGVLHGDAHSANWIADYDTQSENTGFYLIDFGRSVSREEFEDERKWIRGRQQDFAYLLDPIAIMLAIDDGYSKDSRGLEQLFMKFKPKCSKKLKELLLGLDSIKLSDQFKSPESLSEAIEKWYQRLLTHLGTLKRVPWPFPLLSPGMERFTPLSQALMEMDKPGVPVGPVKYWSVVTIQKGSSDRDRIEVEAAPREYLCDEALEPDLHHEEWY